MAFAVAIHSYNKNYVLLINHHLFFSTGRQEINLQPNQWSAKIYFIIRKYFLLSSPLGINVKGWKCIRIDSFSRRGVTNRFSALTAPVSNSIPHRLSVFWSRWLIAVERFLNLPTRLLCLHVGSRRPTTALRKVKDHHAEVSKRIIYHSHRFTYKLHYLKTFSHSCVTLQYFMYKTYVIFRENVWTVRDSKKMYLDLW